MIRSFGDKATEDLFHGRSSARMRRFGSEVVRIAVRKLDMLNAAKVLDDLVVPPGNRLEALRGNLKGFYGIRVNDQFRIVFRWDDGPTQVVLTDYH